jgi:hypothetical protein
MYGKTFSKPNATGKMICNMLDEIYFLLLFRKLVLLLPSTGRGWPRQGRYQQI